MENFPEIQEDTEWKIQERSVGQAGKAREIWDGRFGLENRNGRSKEDAERTIGDAGKSRMGDPIEGDLKGVIEKCEFATARLWQIQKDLYGIYREIYRGRYRTIWGN
jgi:hypothetical protein